MESLESRKLLASDVLISGVDASPYNAVNHGTIVIVDLRDNELSPITSASSLQNGTGSPADAYEGVTGIAVLRDGQLVTAVSDRSGRTASSSSELVVREFAEGDIVRRVAVQLDGNPLALADLTTDPTDNRLIGITTSIAGSTETAKLVEIDPETGIAILIGDTGLSGEVSIAMGTDGPLYATSQDNGFAALMLHRIDATDGSVIDSRPINDVTPFGFTTGLAVQPETGLLYGTESHLGRYFTIDPETLTRDFLSTQSPLRGVSGDVAFLTRRESDDVRQLFFAGFNEDADGFTIDNTGGDIDGLWDRSFGRREDGLLNHSLNGSFYYGLFETANGGGHTILDLHHRGVISSPEIELPADGTSILSFSYLLDTRPELTRDFVTVSIDDGTNVTPILSRADGTLPETLGQWLTASYDLSAFAGQTVSVDFEYDSGDPVRVDPEGWYVDDVVIVHLNDPPPLQVNLSSQKDSDKGEVAPGDLLTYTISVTNQIDSESDASNVIVTDTLPPEVTLVEAGTTLGFTIGTGGEIVFPIDRLAIGETQTFTIVTRVNDLTPATDIGGEIIVMSNSVAVMADQPDPDISDNTSTQDVDRITPERVDLQVEKSTEALKAAPGDRLTYSILVTNLNDSNMAATNVVVTDTLPDNVTIVESETTPGFAQLPGNQIAWTLDVLALGATAEFTLVIDYDLIDLGTVSDLTNTASATSDQPDPDATNSNDEVTTPVPTADLMVEKTVSDRNPSPGDTIEFTVTVTNLESSRDDATGIVATDLIPAGLTVLDPSNDIIVSAGSYDLATGIWDGFDLPIGMSETLQISVRVDNGFESGILTNTASVASDDPDPDDSDNVASVTVVPTQTVQFVTPLSVFRATASVKPADSQIAASGFVWNDQNADGLRDADEAGIDGVVLNFVREVDANQDGPELFSSIQTRTVDVNGDGIIDPITESGFWFLPLGVLPDASYQVQVVRPDDVSLTSPTTATPEIEIIASTDAAILDFGLSRDFVFSPSADRGTISGFAWADVDQDGAFDVEEKPRTNAQIFVDSNNDGIFDPQLEQSSFTDDLGRFVFADLEPGTYFIREFDVDQAFGIGDADRTTVFLQTFPANASETASAFHEVELTGGSVVQGQSGTAEAPNFGVNEVARFVRPADQLEFWLNDYAVLDDALMVYQSFAVSNTTDQPFSITGISEAELIAASGDYVSVKQVDANGDLVEPVFPIQLQVGASTSFLAFYDPALRDANGQVESQQPDWFGSNPDRSVHEFVPSERLDVQTDQGFEFRVQLLGGSTFDSDISYDGLVDNADLALLADLLLTESTIVQGESVRFDPTFDINARHPNGAQDSLAPTTFQDGGVLRELSLGDFGPINVEIAVSVRDPLPLRIPSV